MGKKKSSKEKTSSPPTKTNTSRRRSSLLSEAEQNKLADAVAKQAEDPKRDSILEKNEKVAPVLQAAAKKLENQMNKDTLGHRLAVRADIQKLEAQGITESGVAPGLQGVKKKLEEQIKKDRVNHLLEQRSDLDDLVKHDIVHDPHIAPAIQNPLRKLQKNLAKSNLYHALQHRPAVSELADRGILVDDRNSDDADYEDANAQDEGGEWGASDERSAAPQPEVYRSVGFQLTRILFKTIADLSRAGGLSQEQKGALKDLVVDQDQDVLAVAMVYYEDGDEDELRDSLVTLANNIAPSERY